MKQLIVHIGKKCNKISCVCHNYKNKPLKKIPRFDPPFYEGCDCYICKEDKD